MKIISVIPLKKGILKDDLTYFTSLPVAIGDVVSVSLRNKNILALVTSLNELGEEKSSIKNLNFNLKKVIENKGVSVFLKKYLETLFDVSKYFANSNNSTFSSLVPNIFIEQYDKIAGIAEKTEHAPEKNGSATENKLRAEKLLLQCPLNDRIAIYKTLIRESFARGKSVFMLLPTEFDIQKFSGEVSKGIDKFVFIAHSGISDKKNLSTFEAIITSTHPVLVIATPPYLSIPRNDIATIILEHENSSAYKTIRRPYVDLRTFAEVYAAKINAKFIIADEILRLETTGRKDLDNLHPLYPLSYRLDFDGDIKVLGKRKTEGAKFKIIDEEGIGEINSVLKNKKNIFIFSLRKGLATTTVCRDCGDTITCSDCQAPLVLYVSHTAKKRMFVCNRCEKEINGDTLCKSCGSWNLIPLGIGTDTVYDEIKKKFPKTKIFKLDKESARTEKGAKEIVKEFEGSSGAVLVGTEMAFFYLRKKVPVSIVASFDSLWSIPNFKMGERVIQIALSLARNTKEKIIIQTKNEKDAAILAFQSGNLLPYMRDELEDRKKLKYPPYSRFIKITHLGDKEQTLRAKKFLGETLKEYSPVIFSGFIAKLKGKYVTNALIRLNPEKWSLPELSAGNIDEDLLNKLLSLPTPFEVRVDPEDLL